MAPVIGPMPTGRRWKGLPVPFFFQQETAEAFHQLEMRDDDVVMSSLTKGGTTWVHKVLHLLLHGVADDGSLISSDGIGATNQIYPDAIVKRRGAACDPLNPPEKEALRVKLFGEWGFEDDLCAQPSPRLFSTHFHGEDMLPAQLLAPDGKGRLIIVLRNLKDTLTSLHFFQGEAKDGWLGNEHGPGSLARFIDADCPNAYGSPFDFVRHGDAAVAALQPSGRVLAVYYEDLIRCLPAQVAASASVALCAAVSSPRPSPRPSPCPSSRSARLSYRSPLPTRLPPRPSPPILIPPRWSVSLSSSRCR